MRKGNVERVKKIEPIKVQNIKRHPIKSKIKKKNPEQIEQLTNQKATSKRQPIKEQR